MHSLFQKLLASGPVLTDGAWGTELQCRGLGLGEFPDTWNVTHPEQVGEVARAYVAAGSQVILTNTFGANRLRLAEQNAPFDVQQINRRGVEISRMAASERALVFASIGPSGKLLVTGDIDPGELQSAFAEQAQALAEAGADALLVESLSDLEEASVAVRAAKETGLPVVASMVFNSGKDKTRTIMGQTPEQAARALGGAGADALGANCGQGISGFIPVCRQLRAASPLPIWIKPNAGLPRLSDGRAHYDTSPAEFAAFVPALLEAGANFIGGCCGTRPDFIAAMKDVLAKTRRAEGRLASPTYSHL
ncbi:MAG TPA: homocysteine S-methyltransferase family protein [Verrucomicrobiae bacterium]|nr:homocysteine S-methyltransferase family protein [Verrucomicrobiae bacterium]